MQADAKSTPSYFSELHLSVIKWVLCKADANTAHACYLLKYQVLLSKSTPIILFEEKISLLLII